MTTRTPVTYGAYTIQICDACQVTWVRRRWDGHDPDPVCWVCGEPGRHPWMESAR